MEEQGRHHAWPLPDRTENAHRKAAAVAIGDEVEVELELDAEPRVVVEPPDFDQALDANPVARAAYDRLAYTHKREHVRAIESAKKSETRVRRIEKAIATLQDPGSTGAPRRPRRDTRRRIAPHGEGMSKLRLSITMSLDGYVAGPDQSEENPLGVGGMELHEWFFPLRAFREMHGDEGGESNVSSAVVEERRANIGATIMGRNMFGGGSGPWGDDPGGAGGARTRLTTIRCSCSPTTRACRSRWRAPPPSTS